MVSGAAFDGKVALVTGGASGIGAATVRAFSAAGASIIITDIAAEPGEALAAELQKTGHKAEFVRADVTRESEVAAIIDHIRSRYGRLDFAHNNVGSGETGVTIETSSEERWDWTFAISLKSTWLCMKHEVPLMRTTGGGSIVNTSSMAGVRVTFAASPAYSAAKAAVLHLGKYAAAAYARDNIRVNCVSPGLTATPHIAAILTEERQRDIANEAQLFARAVKPEEVAAAVVYLCSDAAAMVTGENLKVCGGER